MTERKETSSDKLDTLSASVQSLTFDNERVIKPAILEIKESLQKLPNGFATKEELADFSTAINKRFIPLELSAKRSWVRYTVSAILGAILASVVGFMVWLIQYAITHQ